MTRLLRPAVFLDRDGTLNDHLGYVRKPEEIVLLPGVGPALGRLSESGFLTVVVTNQSAVGRGYITEEELGEVHGKLIADLADEGGVIDAVYFCPHHPADATGDYLRTCECRKPRPGMLKMAAEEHGIRLEDSFMVGDSSTDLEAGWDAGCRSVLVLTGHGRDVLASIKRGKSRMPDFVAEDLAGAMDWLLRA